MNPEVYAVARSPEAIRSTNKVIKNTYILLSATLLFSALMAGVSMFLAMPPMAYMISVIGGMVLGMFVLPRTANSSTGLLVLFVITGMLGFGLGAMLTMYAALPNGPQVIGTALGGTGVIFLALSGYALTTRRDFSFMGGFLTVGFVVILLAAIAGIFIDIPAFHLALSGGIILLMSGFILFDTSRLINGGETNYIMATFGLYMTIFNIFVHLLHLLGAFSGDD